MSTPRRAPGSSRTRLGAVPRSKRPPPEPLPLRDACVVAAQAVIAERGVEGLSLRDVARRLGVSHQAPYRHYPSRDHLLAEVMRRCFERFAQRLDAREPFDDPRQDLASLGRAYLDFAQQHPLEYRLMFGTPWPDAAGSAGLVRDATHAFDILRQVTLRLHGGDPARRDRADLDALYIWSSMHGIAGVMHGPCIDHLAIRAGVRRQAMAHVLAQVGRSLDGST